MEWLKDIPEQAWTLLAGLGGALITLLVTRNQTRAEMLRLDKQLSNEKIARTQEREMALRREIYFGVIDSISIHINTLSKFAEISTEKFSEVSNAELTAKSTRLQLVAGDEVLALFHNCSNAIGSAYMELMPIKLNIISAEISAKSETDLFNIALKECREITQKLETLELSSEARQRYFETQTQQNELMNKHIANGEELNKIIFLAKIDLIKAQKPWLQKIGQPLGDLLNGMRKELLPLTSSETFDILTKLTNESIRNQQAHLQQTLEMLESKRIELDL